MESSEKKPGLRLPTLTALATGQVIGAGVVTLVGASIALTGRSVWPAYMTAVVMGFCIIFPYIMLASMLRVKGGNYTFVATLLGEKWGGMYGMAFTMNVFACGMFGLSLGQYLNALFPALDIELTAVVMVTAFYIFNMMGVNFMARIQYFLSGLLIAGLLVFVLVGAGQLRPDAFDFSSPEFLTNGMSGFFAAVVLLVFSCNGHSFVVAFSKEAENAKRDIPWAIILTTGIIFVIYSSIALVDSGILPVAEVAGRPLTVVAQEIMSAPLYYAFVIGGPITALATTLNSSLTVFARPFHQMTYDGWFSAWFGKTNGNGVPTRIITLMYLIAIVPILLGLSVNVITSNCVLLGRVADIVAIIAVITLPKRLPEAWENRYFRLSLPVFYAVMFFCLGVAAVCMLLSMGNMPTTNVYVTVGLAAIFLAYATLRQKSGKVTMQKSYELQ